MYMLNQHNNNNKKFLLWFLWTNLTTNKKFSSLYFNPRENKKERKEKKWKSFSLLLNKQSKLLKKKCREKNVLLQFSLSWNKKKIPTLVSLQNQPDRKRKHSSLFSFRIIRTFKTKHLNKYNAERKHDS